MTVTAIRKLDPRQNFVTHSFWAIQTLQVLRLLIAILITFFSLSLLFIEYTSLPPATVSQMKRRSNKQEYGVTTIRDATQQRF
jgi:hypothetical protein